MHNLLIPKLRHNQFSSLYWIYRNIYREKRGGGPRDNGGGGYDGGGGSDMVMVLVTVEAMAGDGLNPEFL